MTDNEDSKIVRLLEDARGLSLAGDFKKALDVLRNVVKINTLERSAWMGMAVIYSELGKFNKAIECGEKIIKSYPRDTEVWEMLGFIHMELWEYRNMIDCWERVLSIDPDYPRNEVMTKKIAVFNKRLPIIRQVTLPCEIDGSCPYEYNHQPERDIEGMPFIEGDSRSCPIYGHICPEFMEEMDLTLADLKIRSTLHCGLVYRNMNSLTNEIPDEAMESLMHDYESYLKRYPMDEYPKYYY